MIRRGVMSWLRHPAARATLVAATLAACGPAPTPSDPGALPPPSASASTSAEPPLVEETTDGRVVRCGVDDLPKNVVGETAVRTPFLAKPMPDRMDIDLPEAPQPRVEIARRPLDASLSEDARRALDAVNPQYEVCSPVMTQADVGTARHVLEIGAAGLPIRVRSAGEPTRFTRCLMERSCQLKAPRGPLRVEITLDAKREEPPPPPPPPPPPTPFVGTLRITPAHGAAHTELVRSILDQCRAGTMGPLRLVLRVTQTRRKVPSGRRRVRVTPFDTETQVVSRSGAPSALGACMANGLHALDTISIGGGITIDVASK